MLRRRVEHADTRMTSSDQAPPKRVSKSSAICRSIGLVTLFVGALFALFILHFCITLAHAAMQDPSFTYQQHVDVYWFSIFGVLYSSDTVALKSAPVIPVHLHGPEHGHLNISAVPNLENEEIHPGNGRVLNDIDDMSFPRQVNYVSEDAVAYAKSVLRNKQLNDLALFTQPLKDAQMDIQRDFGNIDAVFLYTDAADIDWQQQFQRVFNSQSKCQLKLADFQHRIQFVENDPLTAAYAQPKAQRGHLRYVLRSLYRHAKWLRTVVLVVSSMSQVPAWLDTRHQRIRIVLHSDILPAVALPTFSRSAVESALHRILNLTDQFFYFGAHGTSVLLRDQKSAHSYRTSVAYFRYHEPHHLVSSDVVTSKPAEFKDELHEKALRHDQPGELNDDWLVPPGTVMLKCPHLTRPYDSIAVSTLNATVEQQCLRLATAKSLKRSELNQLFGAALHREHNSRDDDVDFSRRLDECMLLYQGSYLQQDWRAKHGRYFRSRAWINHKLGLHIPFGSLNDAPRLWNRRALYRLSSSDLFANLLDRAQRTQLPSIDAMSMSEPSVQVHLLYEALLHARAQFVFGAPPSTERDMSESLEYTAPTLVDRSQLPVDRIDKTVTAELSLVQVQQRAERDTAAEFRHSLTRRIIAHAFDPLMYRDYVRERIDTDAPRKAANHVLFMRHPLSFSRDLSSGHTLVAWHQDLRARIESLSPSIISFRQFNDISTLLREDDELYSVLAPAYSDQPLELLKRDNSVRHDRSRLSHLNRRRRLLAAHTCALRRWLRERFGVKADWETWAGDDDAEPSEDSPIVCRARLQALPYLR